MTEKEKDAVFATALRQARAEKHWREHQYDFEVTHVDPTRFDAVHVYCTTQEAQNLESCLAKGWTVIAVHPEFLGWTVKEIEENLE